MWNVEWATQRRINPPPDGRQVCGYAVKPLIVRPIG